MRSDIKIVELLATDVSSLNTENFRNLKDNPELRNLISPDDLKQLRTGLQNYTKLMQTFNFADVVWKRKFVGNPFEYFFTTINKQNSEYLVIKKLEPAFKSAYTAVKDAEENIAKIASSLISNLSSQHKQSGVAMAELRGLDILGVRNTKKEVVSQYMRTIKAMEKLLKSVENVNKIPWPLKPFLKKKSWLDNIAKQLEAVELAHKTLEITIGDIYP